MNTQTAPPPDIHRPPPHSLEAEQGVLGSMLLSRDAIAEVVDKVDSEFFYVPAHQTIFGVLVDLWRAQRPADLITFTQILRDRNLLESVGGPALVTNLLTFVPTAANVSYYVDIVRDKYILRSIIAAATLAARRAYEEQDDVTGLLDEVLASLSVLGQERVGNALRPVWEGIQATIQKFKTAFKHRGHEVVDGLATGFHQLDLMLSGIKPQQLVTIAALTSHGKSALANNILKHIGVDQNTPCAKWSLEMSFEEESDRLACSDAGVSLQRIRDGYFKREEVMDEIPARLESVFKGAPMWIDDTRGLSILDIRARITRATHKLGLKCAIVDYLGLLNSTSKRASLNRAIEIGEITHGLKSLAKELKIPIILAAQLNREGDKRASAFRRPKLSDLKDSSSIEQDSDVVIFVWRPIRFSETDQDAERIEKAIRLEALNNKLEAAGLATVSLEEYAELIIAKQRNGPVTDIQSGKGLVTLRYVGRLTRFENLTPKQWSNNPEEQQFNKGLVADASSEQKPDSLVQDALDVFKGTIIETEKEK